MLSVVMVMEYEKIGIVMFHFLKKKDKILLTNYPHNTLIYILLYSTKLYTFNYFLYSMFKPYINIYKELMI